MRYLILLCSLMSLMACEEPNDTTADCVSAFLEENEMVPYVDQEMGCQFFLELYEYENKQYFLLGNHCADMESFPIDCEGNALCDRETSIKCEGFYNNAVNMGIVGIQ